MHDRLRKASEEYADILKQLEDPAVYGDPQKLKVLRKRESELAPLIELLREQSRLQQTMQEMQDLQQDPDLKEMAIEEQADAQARLADINEKMKEFLVPTDPLDDRNIVLEVRAGTGGEEAALFASELLRMYIRYAERSGWKTMLIDKADAEGGGIKEAIVRIEGAGAYGKLRFEGGVHRVQRIPATENKGRVHTSAATVAVLPEAEDVDIPLRTEDLRIDTYRASGAGGQHVNKTESAVRITHLPTGVVVSCQTERSQLQNRARALELLRTRLYALERERQQQEAGSLRSKQVGTGDRSEKIRTYNFPQDRLSDHRLAQNFHHLPGIMDGDIEPLVTSLRQQHTEERLASI